MKTELDFLRDALGNYALTQTLTAQMLMECITIAKYNYNSYIESQIDSEDRFEDNKPI